MKKKRIIQISAVVAALVVAVGCILAGTMLLHAQSQQEKEKRAESCVANITEVFHDQANEYITPDEPTASDDITLRIRTARYNVTKAQIQYTTDEGKTWQTADMEFEKHDDTGYYDFFKGTIPAQSETLYYRFICSNDNEENTVFVDRRLLPETAEMEGYETCFVVIPGFSTPDWAKGALWYSLMPDAFFNGDTSNDVTVSDTNQVNSWNNVHLGLSDKYGGDLAGVMEKIDYFKELGVDGVYMNPVFRSSQNAGYGGIDFLQIEPSFGNEETFRQMCNTLHENGLRVMMDAVLTFTASDSIYFDSSRRFPLDGAYESKDSEFYDLYAYYEWPDNYLTTWGGAATNLSNEAAQRLFYSEKDSFLQHYTAAPYGVDGWRFDCGGWLWGSTEDGNEYASVVMGRIRDSLKEVSPEVLLISESDSGNLTKGIWDAEWNLSLLGVIDRYAEGVTNEAGLRESLRNTVDKYPRSVALCMNNMRSQHDHNRVTGTTFVNDKASVLVQMTYIGSPSIYYGEEIGLNRDKSAGVGSTSSFYAMEWDESCWDYEKYNLYRALGELKQEYSAVKTGAIKDLLISSNDNIYAFGRWDDKGTVITVASQNEETVQVELNARSLSVADGTVFTDWFTGEQYTVNEDGMILADVIPGGSILVKGKKSSKYKEEEQKTSAAENEVNCDDFENGTDSVMFADNSDENVTRKDGKLTISAKDDMVSLTTAGKKDDWTFKARLESSVREGAYAGVLCTGGKDKFVAVGRATMDGEPVIFIGRTTDGTVLIDKYVQDMQPDSPVTVQLQRIGTTYSAVYSYDDKQFKTIGSSIFANYSSEKVGVFARNMENAEFDYVSFGDSIHDGSSLNTPYSDGMIDLNYSTSIVAQRSESMKIVSGEWEYDVEGYYQSEDKGTAQLGIDNKQYNDVRVNVTLKLEDGEGSAGIGFGKKAYDSKPEEGYFLEYTKDNKLILRKNGQKMADATVKPEEGEALRILLETEGDVIRVYAGQKAERVMFLEDTGYVSGYISFYTLETAARFMNYRVSSMESQWNQLSGSDTVYGGANVISCTGQTSNTIDSYGTITRMGVAVTDFVATGKLRLGSRTAQGGSNAEGGILFCASEGKTRDNDGISISLAEGGSLILMADGTEVGRYELGETVKQVEIMFVRKDKLCQVYLQGQAEPVITYEDTVNRGGVYQLYSVNNTTTFSELGLEDIHNTAVADSMLVQLWNAGKMPVPEAALYVEDFESQDAWNNLMSLYSWHGSWAIKDGVLSCTKARGYVASTVIHNRIFRDFEMSFKYRFDESDSSGWAHVLLRKSTVNATHSGSNYGVLMSLDGTVQLFNGKETVAKGTVENFKVNNWYELKIICKGSLIQVYNGSSLIISYNDPGYGTTYAKEGFISFDSNQTRYSVDDVIIRPLE